MRRGDVKLEIVAVASVLPTQSCASSDTNFRPLNRLPKMKNPVVGHDGKNVTKRRRDGVAHVCLLSLAA